MSSPHESIWLGYDRRQSHAYAVARYSIRVFNRIIPINGLVLDRLMSDRLYWRPMEIRGVQMWDTLSDAPMSTEFSMTRFLVPHLARHGWALFMDCDILVRENITNLFKLADDKKAVMCVKHDHQPSYMVKMDGQMQTQYARKNWSSVMLFNCEHPSNKKLTLSMINSLPGRDLHRFCWLDDDEIGELPKRYNYLVGHDTLEKVPEPAIVHFTEGLPDLPGRNKQEFAAVWHGCLPYAVGAL